MKPKFKSIADQKMKINNRPLQLSGVRHSPQQGNPRWTLIQSYLHQAACRIGVKFAPQTTLLSKIGCGIVDLIPKSKRQSDQRRRTGRNRCDINGLSENVSWPSTTGEPLDGFQPTAVTNAIIAIMRDRKYKADALAQEMKL